MRLFFFNSVVLKNNKYEQVQIFEEILSVNANLNQ